MCARLHACQRRVSMRPRKSYRICRETHKSLDYASHTLLVEQALR